MTVLYYVHHQGSGHVHRAVAIASALAEDAVPVIGLSSLPRPVGWPGEWIDLPLDTGGPLDGEDVTAGGTLHWVPRGHRGLRARTALASRALADPAVRLCVADVSVEMGLLARLHGVPVVVVGQPGVRDDRAHRTVYDLATRVLLPWPALPDLLRPHPDTAEHVGAVSRYEGRTAAPPPDGNRVLVLWGRGGAGPAAADLAAAAAATPTWSWAVTGTAGPDVPAGVRPLGHVQDVWAALAEADVVVTHAGQNAVAEVAAARRPAIVLPQARPHGEQAATGAALARHGLAQVADGWPAAECWPGLLGEARRRGGAAWAQWSDGSGVARAARLLADVRATA
ncbi:glycosyltransferase [Pseudonocardia oroxyli]|uniref:UDP-N-acetylglucosamine:LPS N-acetylglucosamine transferase n=1 Tax=Pseudonocardia oroxyli TaxID=366584 RepID=A0A1G7X2Y6_PSEOR|nr:glycosyltransferase [Pseudonocardia oroxyli]SDG78554.1 UDP-N-acetylglucosamine:LPS N-acetylglucosamine transferase [Pseudonocardia oroxyli]